MDSVRITKLFVSPQGSPPVGVPRHFINTNSELTKRARHRIGDVTSQVTLNNHKLLLKILNFSYKMFENSVFSSVSSRSSRPLKKTLKKLEQVTQPLKTLWTLLS